MSNRSRSSSAGSGSTSDTQQPSSSTMPGNPDVLFPPEEGNAIPFSQDGLINGWASMPIENNALIAVINGQITFIPLNDEGVLVSRSGKVSIVKANSSPLSLFNNNLGWTETEECT